MLTIFESDDPERSRAGHSQAGRPKPEQAIGELIELAQGGDRMAFGRLIEWLGEDLYRIAKRSVYTNRIDPQDVFQDSLLQAMHSIPALRNKTKPGFLSWFAGIARNRVLTLKAGAARRGNPNKKTPYPWLRMEQYAPEQLDCTAPNASRALAEEGLCPLDPIMTELAPVTRVGWLMREVFGMDWDSVALVLCKGSLAAARQTHYRALRNLGPGEGAGKRTLGCNR